MTDRPPHPLQAQDKPELVIGIVSPVGVDLGLLREVLRDELTVVGYKTIVVRLSSLLSKVKGLGVDLLVTPEDKRIDTHMTAGTKLREATNWGDMLAQLGVGVIREERQKLTGDPWEPSKRAAYIISSLKHKTEIGLLRDVYGEGFLVVSAYAPKEQRIRSLASRIAASHSSTHVHEFLPHAQELVNRDEQEGTDLGQNVADAFPKGDVFVDASSQQRMRESIKRFIQLFFGHPFLTPTRDEFGMYQAAAASLRSCDLSRHVGASIMSKDGDLISVGCNDVPKFGGGSYWCEDTGVIDGRDFQRGYDSSTVAKKEILSETLSNLKDAGVVTTDEDLTALAESLLWGQKSEHMDGSQITNLLEFGRSVHAEMSAITDASKRGVHTKGMTLYSTTFPCHMCARLIIAAGIERVVFIEPYPKSKTQDLFSDSVAVDRGMRQAGYVNFEGFVGVSPERYGSLFRVFPPARKDKEGKAVKWIPTACSPRLRRFALTYLTIEQTITEKIAENLEAFGLELV